MFSWWNSLEVVARVSTASNCIIALLGIWVFIIGRRQSALEETESDQKRIEHDRQLAEARQESSEALKEAKTGKVGAQRAVHITGKGFIRAKGATLYDSKTHGGYMLHTAMIHVGSSAEFAKHPGGHYVAAVSDSVRAWAAQGAAPTDEHSYDFVFTDGGVTTLADGMSVDEILAKSDLAVLTIMFLFPFAGADVDSGEVTITLNAATSKTFVIHSQKVSDTWTVTGVPK